MPPENHQIGSGFSEQEMQLASFWVRNKLLVRRLAYSALTIICILLWAFTLWSILDAYVISYPRESRIPALITQNQLNVDAMSEIAPKALQASDALTFPNPSGKKDLLAELTNPNPEWWLEFEYQFDLSENEKTPVRKGFILPNQTRYVSELGYDTSSTAIGAKLDITSLSWHRIHPDLVEKNYEAFKAKRLQLEAKDITQKNDLVLGTKTLSQTSFTLSNPSSFGFWDVQLFVVLLRAGSPVAVTSIDVREIKPGEDRPVVLNWGDTFNGISSAEVYPVVNILDPNTFLPTTKF